MSEVSLRKKPAQAQRGIATILIIIWIITVLEFPAPVGFETRSQANVSHGWLILFFAIVFSEIAAMIAIFRHPRIGARLAIAATSLNILQILADQTHMMQPERATFGYSLLEYCVGFLSLGLLYLALKILRKQAA